MAVPGKTQKKYFFSSIYDAFISNESALRRYISRMVYRPEDIDDMVQETFLRAYNATSTREIEHPKAYLFRVAKSVAARELRKKANQVTDFMAEASAEAVGIDSSPEQQVEADQKIRLYCDAIADLPPQCRRIFLMRKYQAMSHRDIAKALNITVGAVEKQISRGIRRCAIYLDNKETPLADVSLMASEQGGKHD